MRLHQPEPHAFASRVLAITLALSSAAAAFGFIGNSTTLFAQKESNEAKAESSKGGGNDQASIVVVDGKKITQLEVEKLFDARFQQRMEKLPAEKIAELRKRMRPVLVDELLSKQLFLKEAVARKIEANKNDVAETYNNFVSGFKTDKELQDYLKLINRTQEKVIQEITEEQTIQLLIQQEMKNIKIPESKEMEAKLKKLYTALEEKFVVPEKVRVRHILIAIPEGEDRPAKLAEKEAEAKALRKKLVEDETIDFAKFATEHSECPSRERGGSLGEVKRGVLVKEFEDAAFSQKVGEIGPVVKSEYGYHIIQVLAHSAKEKIPFEKAKNGMVAEFLRNIQKEETAKLIDKLKAKAKIEWIDSSAKTAAE